MRRNFYRDRREAAHNREFGPAELRPVLTADQALAKAAETLTRAAAERDRAVLLPAGAELHATLRLNYRGRYATCESTGDPRAAIQQLIEECSK